MCDEYILNSSNDLTSSDPTFDVVGRRILKINDNNGGNYTNGEVHFDLSTMSNSGLYCDWKTSILQVPIAIQVSRSVANTAQSNFDCFFASLKNGNFCLVDALALSLSQQPVITMQPNLYGKVSYELATNMSADDAERAIKYNYAFEDGDAYSFHSVASAYGTGNSVVSVKNNLSEFDVAKQNKGRLKRMKAIVDPSNARIAAHMDSGTIVSKQISIVAERSVTRVTYYINALIPLDILHDYFRKCPISKNSLYDLTVYLNAPASVVCTASGAIPAITSAATMVTKVYNGQPVITNPHQFNPIQLSSIAFEDGADKFAANDNVITASLTIGMPTDKPATYSMPKTCTLLMSMLQLNPAYEKHYLSDTVKEFSYEEVTVKKITNVLSKDAVEHIVTNNLSRLRKIVILPYLAAYTDPTTAANSHPNALMSPWDSFACGYLSSPNSTVTNFNVHVSGIPVFQNNLASAVEFYREFQHLTLNGAVDSAVFNSSLIDQLQYNTQYGAIVADLTRHNEAEDGLAKSVTVQFTNASERTMNYLVYLYYDMTIKIDCEKGNIVL